MAWLNSSWQTTLYLYYMATLLPLICTEQTSKSGHLREQWILININVENTQVTVLVENYYWWAKLIYSDIRMHFLNKTLSHHARRHFHTGNCIKFKHISKTQCIGRVVYLRLQVRLTLSYESNCLDGRCVQASSPTTWLRSNCISFYGGELRVRMLAIIELFHLL